MLPSPHAGSRFAPHARGRLMATVATLVLVALALQVQSAVAGIGWCKSDPVVLIDGHPVDIFVSAPADAPLRVTGPTEIVVTVPVGVSVELVVSDLGFGRGEVVTFAESHALRVTDTAIGVKVAAYVPTADDGMPVLVEVAPRVVGLLSPASAEGAANEWVRLKTAA